MTPYYQDDAVTGMNRLQRLLWLLTEPGTPITAQPHWDEASLRAAGFGVREAGSVTPPTFEEMWATVQRRKP